MQDQKPPPDPFQGVWPVGPTVQPFKPKGEPTPETTETPVLLPVDILLRPVDSAERARVDTGFAPLGDRPVASWRATIDPDNYTGFGTWSGPSFADPVAAAAIAGESSTRLQDAPEARAFTLVVT